MNGPYAIAKGRQPASFHNTAPQEDSSALPPITRVQSNGPGAPARAALQVQAGQSLRQQRKNRIKAEAGGEAGGLHRNA